MVAFEPGQLSVVCEAGAELEVDVLDAPLLETTLLDVGAKVAFGKIAPQALDLAKVGPRADFK